MTLYSLIASSLAGPGAPANSVGVDGAIYLDLTTGLIYGPKTAGVWPPLPGSISAIQDEGSALSTRAALNFTGAGVTATDDPANNRTNVTIPGATPPALVTSLPGSPADGQEIYYQADATNGIIWHLRYRAASASAYKWEYAGGAPLHGEYGPFESTSLSASTWGGISVNDPKITVPLSGDYDCEHFISAQLSQVATVAIGLKVGATEPTIGTNNQNAYMFSLSTWVAISQRRRVTGVAAASAIQQRYLHIYSAPATYGRVGAALSVTPIRVG